MQPQPRPSFYTLTTTDGRQATLYAAPDADPWQAATQYARASFAHDSQLAQLRIASPAEIAALSAPQPDPAAVQPPEPGSEAALSRPLPLPDAPAARGSKLNLHSDRRKPLDHPVWATRPQQETWRTGILVVWDENLQRIVGLGAGEAVGLLDYLRANTAWQTDGIQVGPSDKFSRLDDPHWEPGTITRDQIAFDTATAQQLFELLQESEQTLQALAQNEQRQARHALSRAYGVLVDAAKRAQAQRAQQEDAAQAEPDSQASPS